MDSQLVLLLSVAEVMVWTQTLAALLTSDTLYLLACCFLAQYGALKFYRLVIYPHFVSPMRNMPGPKDNHPLIGQFLKVMLAPTPYTIFMQWSEQWPREPFIRYLTVGNQEQLLVNTPEAHKEVLQTYCYSFKKPDLLFRFIGDFSGRGLLFQEGDEHKKQRRILMETFTLPNLKKIFPVFQSKSKALAGLFGQNLDENGQGVIDVVDCYHRLGMDVAGLGILGVELETLTSSNPKWNFLACYHYVLNSPLPTAIVTAINTQVPIRNFLPIEANLGYLGACRRIRKMVRQLVHQRVLDVEKLANNDSEYSSATFQGRDLLSIMIKQRAAAKEADDVLSEEEMVNQVLIFFVAGFETVSGMSTWASYVMATRPDIQDKLRSEVVELLDRTPGDVPSWEEIDRLHYLNNFCKEVLRVHCPVITTYREAITDLTICGTYIPKGATVFIQPAVTNLSKTIWGPDAEEFVVERWDNLIGESSSPYSWNPFLNGPRICIGKIFALMEAKAQLVEVVSNFRFVMSPELEALGGKFPPVQNPSVSLTPKGGLRVGVERI